MEARLRKAGTKIIGDVPWGTHLCQFYEKREDLVDILVPYFKAGLESNEFCMWITSEPLKAEDAKASLKKVVKKLDHFIEKGQIEILDYSEWYTKSGKFDADNVLQGWVEKENQALKRGHDGLRLSGNTFWLGKRDWKNFTEYEEEINNVIGKYRMIAICTYSLGQCGASEIIDVVSNHQFALIRREGKWVTIESSEHKRAEKALGESEATIRALIESPVDSILLVNPDGIILETNQTFAQRIDRRIDELIGRCIYDFLPPELAKSRRARVDEIVRFGVPIRFEDERTGMQLDQSAYPIFNAQGKVTKIAIIARDITERKRAEEEIKNLAKFPAENPFPILRLKQDGIILYANEASQVLLRDWGCMVGNYAPKFWRDLVAEALSRQSKRTVEVKFDEQTYSFDVVPILNPGYVNLYGQDITARKRAEDGIKKLNEDLERRVIERTTQLETINKDMQKDITERNKAEEALKASETRYRRLFESAKDGILLLDADTGQITDVNPYLIKMLGYSHNEFLGKKLWEIGLFKQIAENQAGFQKLQSEKYIRYENLPLETKEGRHIDVEFVSNVYSVDHQTVIQCNIRDITARRWAEEKLKKHEERLEELVRERTQKIRELERQRTEIEKLAAAGLMAARIAHEINNPLAGIKNSFLLVKDAIPQEHPYYEYVGRIDNEINRIARIVRQMFDVYRPEQEIKKEFSVDKTLYEVVSLLEAAWRENNITIETDSKPITMEMPEGLLRQVLYNILVNAIEASPQGGVVKITTEVGNEILTLLISDQGGGIPLEVQPRIFEPFFTSKDGSRKGLGLGLSVSKDIVKKLGGDIGFESEPGKGTLFRIILPLKSGERR